MWDLHGTSASITTIATVGTILLGGDKATVAGVPSHGPGCTLMYHGIFGTLADTLLEYRLYNNDMPNPRQGFDVTFNASSLIAQYHVKHTLKSQLQRLQQASANTGTMVATAYTLDYYTGVGKSWTPNGDWSNIVADSNTFGATTAVTWQDKTYVPTVVLEAGTYAILGAKATALTTNPYGLVRFGHNDFAGFHPGFPVNDNEQFALARGNVDNDVNQFYPDGRQFVAMGECPVFTAGAEGTGLTLQMETTSAVTPQFNIILKKLTSA